MQNKLPFVSVIVPVFNGEATVMACIQSLLSQDYPKDLMEIIVVDNGSTDGTVRLLQPFVAAKQILLVSYNETLNSYGARNRGVKAAKGQILAFTDADCTAKNNWLTILLSSSADEKIGAFIGDNLIYDPQTVIERYYDSLKTIRLKTKDLNMFPGMRTSNCAIRRECFEKLGGFRATVTSGGDSVFLKRMITDTPYKFKVELEAIVFNKNYDNLTHIFRRCLRFGTIIDTFKDDPFLSINYIPRGRNFFCAVRSLAAILVRLITFPVVGVTKKYRNREIQDLELFLMEPVINFVEFAGFGIGRTFKLKSFR